MKEIQSLLAKFSTERASASNLEWTFSEGSEFISAAKVFVNHYKKIPNEITITSLNCKKLLERILLENEKLITNCFFEQYIRVTKEDFLERVFIFLAEDTILRINFRGGLITILYNSTEIEIIEKIKRTAIACQRRSVKDYQIGVITSQGMDVDIEFNNIKKPKFNLDLNYNDDFKEIDKIIRRKLSASNLKGVILLHGSPGTGKTTYVRNLICSFKKKMILLSPNFVNEISMPRLLTLLIQYNGSVLIIEDAETLLKSREHNNNTNLSMLLNISDGLLSDVLNLQIICTFNMPVSKIDAALLRPGRLLANYEFKKLTMEKSSNLSRALGFENSVNSEMTLAEIYNQNERQFHIPPPKNTIGFRIESN